MKFDVIIMGAGPAGMLAAWGLEGTGLNYIVLEKGKKYIDRDKEKPYDVSYGFGGAGLFSDGKISYFPAASKLWGTLEPVRLHWAYNRVKSLFEQVGIVLKEWNDDWVKITKNPVEEMIKEYESLYVDENQRRQLLELIYAKLSSNIVFNKNVKIVSFEQEEFSLVCEDDSIYSAFNLIVATGKKSCSELFGKNNDIQWNYWSEMGVRIEVDTEKFLPQNKETLDYKLIGKIDENTEIRTFCSCKKGVVRKSLYGSHITYNGEALECDEAKSNIGIVIRTTDINSEYAKEMQDVYLKGEEKECSISEYEAGISIIGERTDSEIKNIIEQITKGDCNGKVYGPEIEKYGVYPLLDGNLMCRKGLYFVGDATAIFRGLLAAFVSGVYVAGCISENRRKIIQASMEKLKIKKSDTEDMKLIFTAQSKAYFYCRDVICQFVFEKGYLPINPFRVFDYFLGDRVKRDMIRRGNNQLIKTCDELWVFGSIADGVLFEIASAIDQGKKIRFFTVGTTIQEIKEIDTNELTFEPEVHARKIKKQDIIDFINQGKGLSELNNYVQLSFDDILTMSNDKN